MAADVPACVDNNLEPDKGQEANAEKKENQVDYDELLSSAGEFGRYQLLLSFATFPFYFFGVFVYFSQLFMTEVPPNHWCWVPELENLTDVERRSLAIPKDENARFGYSQCFAYAANWTKVLETGENPHDTWPIVPCQNGWEFNKTEIPYPTISIEMEWVCSKNSYQATAQSIFFLGSVLGGLFIGWIADKYGRLPAAVISSLLGCVGGITSSFARNFTEFATCRFFAGMAYDNCMIMVYLLVLEYIAPKYKTLISNMAMALFYSSAAVSLPWIAVACGDWKIFSLVTSIPLGFAILTPLLLPESPRWLLSKGRVDDAVNKVLTIGRINRKEVPAKLIEQFKISVSMETKEESQSCLEIFKRPLLRRTLILMCLEYMCCTVVFDGLVRSLGQLDFDFFVSFSLVSFTEFPSIIIVAFVMDWMGRRWLTIVFMIISCVFSIMTVFVARGVPSVICAVIARFGVNLAYTAAMQWAAEVLPTSVRGSGVAIVHICGYVATVLSPYVVYLKTYLYWLPLVVIGCLAGLGALIAVGLPETARRDMPHTFDDAEELSRNQKFWDIPCLRKEKAKGYVNESFEM